MTCIDRGCKRVADPGWSRCGAHIALLLKRMGLA